MTTFRMFRLNSNRKQMFTGLLLLTVIVGTEALRDVKVIIPPAAKIGETITLQCDYDLEKEPLYTVKWYKGQNEFFRYIPKELPNTQIFAFNGIDIDVSKSIPSSVVLRNVQQNMTGKYGCEVSTDAPNFYTLLASGYLYVTNAPVGDPNVTIEKDSYEVGYTLRGNCTSPPAFPAVNLTWYLNGKKVNASVTNHVIDASAAGDKRKPIVTVIGLEMEMDSGTFNAGRALLRCSASLFNIYHADVEVVLEEERPRPSSVLGTRDASSGSAAPKGLFLINAVAFVSAIIR